MSTSSSVAVGARHFQRALDASGGSTHDVLQSQRITGNNLLQVTEQNILSRPPRSSQACACAGDQGIYADVVMSAIRTFASDHSTHSMTEQADPVATNC